ncbi:hypothetical protein D3C72_1369440 [compost metagenome]
MQIKALPDVKSRVAGNGVDIGAGIVFRLWGVSVNNSVQSVISTIAIQHQLPCHRRQAIIITGKGGKSPVFTRGI